jgi:hypothetical protein
VSGRDEDAVVRNLVEVGFGGHQSRQILQHEVATILVVPPRQVEDGAFKGGCEGGAGAAQLQPVRDGLVGRHPGSKEPTVPQIYLSLVTREPDILQAIDR